RIAEGLDAVDDRARNVTFDRTPNGFRNDAWAVFGAHDVACEQAAIRRQPERRERLADTTLRLRRRPHVGYDANDGVSIGVPSGAHPAAQGATFAPQCTNSG